MPLLCYIMNIQRFEYMEIKKYESEPNNSAI